MYVVRNSKNEIVAICTRKEDAMAWLTSQKIDKENYTVTGDL